LRKREKRAKKIPDKIASKLPYILPTSSFPKKKRAIPERHTKIVIRFFVLNLVFRKIGSRNNKYTGAVNCRKITFATVVRVVATTNRIRIPENETEQSTEMISNSNFIFLFLTTEIVRIVSPATKDLKKLI
jgi:hypothetical protein